MTIFGTWKNCQMTENEKIRKCKKLLLDFLSAFNVLLFTGRTRMVNS